MNQTSFGNSTKDRALLPEWRGLETDDSAWIAAIEEARRLQFAELADL